MKSLMIAWVGYQRRADTMKQYWAYDILHLPNKFKKKSARPLDYLIKAFKTIKSLFVSAPQVLWVQLPPSPVLHIALAYKFFINRRLKIIADVHNSLLRKQWITFPGTVSLLNKIDAVVVHNFKVKEELARSGVNVENIFILEDLPCDFNTPPASDHQTPYVLFPCSFDVDEPIEIVIKAAREMPNVDFFITGRYGGKLSGALIASMPDNIKLTGFLSKLTFEQLLCNANVVLGLTTRDNVQLSVANEAVSAGRPMALSNTPVLRSLFSDAAVFVDTLDPLSIKFGLSQLIENEELYKEKSALLKAKRITRWEGQAELLKAAVTI
ncbi:glycosyltransferase family 1 protein [Pseudomonas sp. FP1742]|uniref:glycosyltransferase family 1 protein n=1 Tax=Pseudomonas sp. FP1742 TaxID=2954079 RepID=UPI0027373FC3|nr:glycosyltransferase family 1 protein [Pseudomonas sp. FP1742]WLG49033.1 glycosyltransferase family 1 protein [Pseudomonas sp. FP1742]